MATVRSRLGASLLALLCLCAPAAAQTVFDVGLRQNRRVYELPYGPARPFPRRPAFTGKGFRYPDSCSLVYLVNAFPGAYNLGFSHPAGDINLRPAVSVFDRWPYDPRARRYDLPMGPQAPAHGGKIEYRWSIGVSPASVGTLLYVAAEVPAGACGPHSFPHEMFITGPPSSPMHTMEKGITYLSGPADLVLAAGQESVSFAVDKPEQPFDANALAALPIPGDLVRNGSFRNGLNHWTPHRDRAAADDVRSFSLSDGILRIKTAESDSREGVMQRIDADVADAASLFLMADVLVKEQAQGGLGPEGRDAPVAIAVGYRDASGGEEAGNLLFWKGFFALASENPEKDAEGRKVPKGQWYRNIIDLMQLDPKPARILFLSLEGSGRPSREGWVRDVHLIKSGEKK